MPPRSNPTARQVRLGAELRKMRERTGMTAREAARRFGISPMQMSHVEVGRIGIGEERLRVLAGHYGCTDEALVDALVAMTGRQGRGWWEKYRGVIDSLTLDVAELEHHAVALKAIQVVHVPGLLQTEPYMRALFTYLSPGYAPDRLEAVIEFRMRRRQVLERAHPLPFEAVVHEAALRMKVDGDKVAREQLDFILECSERPGVTIRVIPFAADRFAGMGCSMLYAEGLVPQLDTVQIDQVHGSVFIDGEAELDHYRDRLRTMERSALSPEATRDFIQRIAREM
ncbi:MULTISPECIES: helix-turn-helix domain-containing protein [Streptomyces]|uniref:XRE family transcriptional regulator n=2 Tax=Streptomyces TaxID=1883 RepID=A0A3Q9FWE4_STRLT|nr:helix-turn-helix transcriptional regulator [Streptomyces luteoverticillatus]AZQ72402.1 XRE family transcriptional regulator [Streptomyces luteoverticillatus]